MLFTQAARDLRDQVDDRWKRLEAWLFDGAHVEAANKVRASVEPLRLHWHGLNKGAFSDPDEVDSAYHDLETAETYAVEQGYEPPPGYHQRVTPTAALHPAVGATQGVEDWTRQSPALDKVTSPKDVPVGDRCKAAGLPAWVCEARTPGAGDVPWWLWALGAGGVLLVGGAAYVAVKAAPVAVPLALGAYAPAVLPAYQSLARRTPGGTLVSPGVRESDRRAYVAPEPVLRAIAERMAAT